MNIVDETTSMKNDKREEKFGKSSTQSTWISIYNGSGTYYFFEKTTYKING
jgi:hypothetical protein